MVVSNFFSFENYQWKNKQEMHIVKIHNGKEDPVGRFGLVWVVIKVAG